MAGQIHPLKQFKNSQSATAARTISPADGQADDDRPASASRPAAANICSDQTEVLPADTGTPLYNSRIINTYVEYLAKYYPQVDIDAVLRQAGITRHEVEDPGHWFTQCQADSFHQSLAAGTGNPDLAREVGRFASSSERVGAARQYALGSISLASIYMKTGKLALYENRKTGGLDVPWSRNFVQKTGPQ